MRKILLLVLLSIVSWAAACSSPDTARKDDAADQVAESETAESDGDPERAQRSDMADSDIIPVADSPILGPVDAPVTIVVFSEFQCPFCARGASTMDALMEQSEFDGQVRLVFKHYPLPFHPQALPAARAAMAAGEQGKFWEMHDLLFEEQRELRDKTDAQVKAMAVELAESLDLDMAKFEQDFEKPEYADIIERDMALGKKIGVRGTPNFFINGISIAGAQQLERFEEVVSAQLEAARGAMEAGVARDELYKKMVAANFEPPAQRQAPDRRPAPVQQVEKVDIHDDDATRGADNPLVTIVEFSDFQCPFCSKVNPTLERLLDEYEGQVRLVFKHRPLGFHQQADEAAKLAIAAQEEGKFWEMHDLLFENQRRFKEGGIFVELGKKLGMSEAQVERALESSEYQARIDKDSAQANEVGARGTPTLFVNGVKVVGAQPYAKFESVVDKQLAIAKKLRDDKNLSGQKLYEAAIAYNLENLPEAEPEAPQPDRPDPRVDTSKLTIDDDQAKGPVDAPVTIFTFSDFQCPYCARGAQNVEKAMEAYPGKVRLVFKHFPLPFHKEAKPAAIAAMAAGEQGKFWEMHDLLFENQKRLEESGIYAELAKELGLDVSRFEQDMKKTEFAEQIEADMAQGKDVGVRGTPGFFINGVRVMGAQPPAKFEAAIKEALSEKQ